MQLSNDSIVRSVPDQRLIFEDIEGSLAYAGALEKAEILSAEELRQIGKGLTDIKKRVRKIQAG
jgi:argininosuccinate lyase